VRVDYRRRWHEALLEELQGRHGQPRRDSVGSGIVLAWRLQDGMLLVPETPAEEETPALMWVAEQD
jgi:hypothetical protein